MSRYLIHDLLHFGWQDDVSWLICFPCSLYKVFLKVSNFSVMGPYKFPGASSHLKFEDVLLLLSSSTLTAIVTAESFTVWFSCWKALMGALGCNK